MICSTETPGARSNNLKPFGVISKTANSVTTFASFINVHHSNDNIICGSY
jgi:hypothetical protein